MAPTHANPKKPIPSKATATDKSITENPPTEAPQVPSQSDGAVAGLSKSHGRETIEVLWQLFQAGKKKSSKKNNVGPAVTPYNYPSLIEYSPTIGEPLIPLVYHSTLSTSGTDAFSMHLLRIAKLTKWRRGMFKREGC